MALTVEALTTVAEVAAISAEWQRLHDSSGDVNPFSGPDWGVTWLEHFADGRERRPYVLLVRDGDRLVGVAPFSVRRQWRGAATVVQPIGTGDPWIGPFELPGLTVAPGDGRDVARAVVAFLGGDAAATASWDWVDVVLGSSVPWFEPEWLPDWKHTVLVKSVRGAATIRLDGVDNVYAGRRNLKESFRRARNRLTRDFGAEGWSVRRLQAEADAADAFERLVDLHGQRARLEKGQPIHADVLEEPRVRAYLRDVLRRMSARGHVSFYELLVDGEVAATQLILHTATASYSSVSGATEQIWPYSAITYLQSQAVSDAQAAGHRQLCLSTGPTQAKMRWTDTVEMHPSFALIAPRRKSRALYLGSATRDTLSSYFAERRAHRV